MTIRGKPDADDVAVQYLRKVMKDLAEKLTVHPIDMELHCPQCGLQHIDAPNCKEGWTNPPHRSHLCSQCGYIWRPADVPTNGVLAVKTAGKNDSPKVGCRKACSNCGYTEGL